MNILMMILAFLIIFIVMFTSVKAERFKALTEKNRIYQYGYNEKINIQLELKEGMDLKFAYPEYKNGWNLQTEPNGTFKDNKNEYEYLYYNYDTETSYTNYFKCTRTNEGFCVDRENVARFLNEKLHYLGLNDQECEDFITYWTPHMIRNYEYCVISFTNDIFGDTVGLNVTPKPDMIIRVYMMWYGTNFYEEVEPQKLTKVDRPENGKIIAEWSAIEFLNNGTAVQFK